MNVSSPKCNDKRMSRFLSTVAEITNNVRCCHWNASEAHPQRETGIIAVDFDRRSLLLVVSECSERQKHERNILSGSE